VIGRYRKKPVEIEAARVTYDNAEEIADWCGAKVHGTSAGRPLLLIDTLEGVMRGDEGDWIIRGVKGEFYPCKPDIFAATYEPVES
jgi:hypothetical protein